MDFYILTLPKSGSHMLASALDSHPDIACGGEVWRDKPLYDWLGHVPGRVRGAILPPLQSDNISRSTKMIVLMRSIQGRFDSWRSGLGRPHATEPLKIFLQRREISREKIIEYQQQERGLLIAAQNFLHITFDYDEITGGKDIRELPETIGQRLCEFLGVEYRTMTPKFYKPQRVA